MKHPPIKGVEGAGTQCTLGMGHWPVTGDNYAYHEYPQNGGCGIDPMVKAPLLNMTATLEPKSRRQTV